MHVQCPNCRTTYSVAAHLISSAAPSFRCSRCRHVFVLELARAGGNPAAQNAAPDPHERELSLPLFRPQPPSSQTAASDTAARPMAAQTESSSGKAKAPRASTAAQGDSWSLPFPPKDQSPSEGPAAGVPARAADGEFGQTWWSRPAQEEQDQPPAQLSTAPYLGLFALLLALYGWLAVSHASKPGSVERLLRFVPGLESIVFKNNHLRQGLIIESIAQKTQLIRGNREVFTISGSIVNRNPVSVREIRIEAYIFDGDGKEIGRQQIAVGNPISANLIRDVEAKEISILQEIGPQKRFAIPPDESAPFLIVFLKPAKEIKSFAYRVVSVEEAA